MGNCVNSGRGQSYKDHTIVKPLISLLQKESEILKMVYKDLSSRILEHQLNKQNFLLFFHKNGFWGDRLFKEFDATASNLITEEQFIRGIMKIFKTSEEQKIRLLFKFFSGGTKETEGVAFSEFLKMLYNYPKEDLQKILNDSDFINNQIKAHLVAVNTEFKGRRFESVCHKDIKNNNAEYRLEDSDNMSDKLESKVGKDIIRQMEKNKQIKDMTLSIKVDEKDIHVRASSIHQFVKKFARNIFKSYKIPQKTGRLQYEQFRDWLINHKNLYDNYYSGFHSEIWQLDKETHLSQYTSKQPQMTSKGRLFMKKGQPSQKVYLILLHSILLVTNQQDENEPFLIICLDGLSVQTIFDAQNGNGILIRHRDPHYSKKKFFFINQKVQKMWIQQLKYFKGSSINALYNIGHEIGRGKFSLVYEGTQIATGQKYAIKVINKTQLDQQSLQTIAHESTIMAVLSHPLMVNLKENIQTKNNIYIVTELVKGKDLFQLVKDLKYLQQPQAAFIFRQIIVGVRYLHSLGIVHRDLKPENIMVEYDDEQKMISKIRIIDFGFSNYISALMEIKPEQLMAGTPNYIAPEILLMKSINEKLDNFAIGVMLYFALSGNTPFMSSNIGEILAKTMEGAFTLNDRHWKKISAQAKDLVTKLLEAEPDDRISLDEALRHQWLQAECTTNKQVVLSRK